MSAATSNLNGFFELTESSPLFRELWDMYVGFIALNAALALEVKDAQALEKIRQLLDAIKTGAVASVPSLEEIKVGLFHFSETLYIRDNDCQEILVISDGVNLLQKISLPRQERPTSLKFSLVPEAFFDALVTERVAEGTGQPSYLESIWGYVIAAGYERHQRIFKKSYGDDLKKWPPELQFFKHVRNGLYHGGTFDIWPNRIDPARPPQWRHYVMPSANSMNGKRVIGGFVKKPHLPLFIHDMSAVIAGLSS